MTVHLLYFYHKFTLSGFTKRKLVGIVDVWSDTCSTEQAISGKYSLKKILYYQREEEHFLLLRKCQISSFCVDVFIRSQVNDILSALFKIKLFCFINTCMASYAGLLVSPEDYLACLQKTIARVTTYTFR